MHYKNGREVKVGDKVVGKSGTGNPVSGIVVDTNQSEACNIAVLPLPEYTSCNQSAKDFLHIEDALADSLWPDRRA